MSSAILLSILIPTQGRPAKLAACIGALARQTIDADSFEVLVGVDGPGEGEAEAAGRAGAGRIRVGVQEFPKSGQASVRNRLLDQARGSTLLFLNDDMLPEPLCAQRHLEAQQACVEEGRPALIIGSCPWVIHQPDRLFDRLIRETSMVFFFDQMDAAVNPGTRDPGHDWGFRHAWLLNLSVPAAMVREVGGFTVFPSTYGYEDDDLAFRLRERFGARVLYRPGAAAQHDHRYEPADYLQREYMLGYAAWGFARTAPRTAGAMFGRDIASAEEVARSREFIARERSAVERLRSEFLALGDTPASEVADPDTATYLRALYQRHLPLKRWTWRCGHLDAAEGSAAMPPPV
jgi:glycosyltransferase involved in cell wall biosynthesis